ncbi:MAG: hypothetical protein US76_01725 [Parcubacteria group bacterium GW2011_GWA2_38_13b]|nr:MAG: hypothetical protein US76_01725 [Parcubacteria group bacterium GW2011_GWA2_38_13b]
MIMDSKKVIYFYFIIALVLFSLQLPFGIYLASSYALSYPQWVVDLIPFSTARAVHTNLLVLWMLLGFMGGGYFIAMAEGGLNKIFSPFLALLQLIILFIAGVTGIIGFFFGWTQGRPLLELPFQMDLLVILGAVIFLLNITATMYRGWVQNRKFSAISFILLLGVIFTALLYIPGIFFYKNITMDWTAWWVVIHLWVEGSWELIASAVLAFLLAVLTGVDRKAINKWLYIEAGLVLFTGIVGIGHHFYWTGHPDYWLWIGASFSVLEPLPLLLMYWDAKRHLEHKPEFLSSLVGTLMFWSVVLHFIGAGVWGGFMTLPFVNYWTHGTQLTVSHGHLAFYGAFALLLFAVFYVLMSQFKGIKNLFEKRGVISFKIMTGSMIAMTLFFLMAGTIQVCLERIAGWSYVEAQEWMRWWMGFAAIAGAGFAAGAAIMVYDLFFLKEKSLNSK